MVFWTKANINILYPVFALIFLGLSTRFLFAWHPSEVVFDEVHFGKFVSAYYTGEYYFDIHPPLGKLLIAGFASFFGFGAGFDFDLIGKDYGNIPYEALRFLPSLAGALIPAAVFLWLMAMGISRWAGFFAGLLLTLDNALLAQSRFILVDSFLILFGFAGLWLFFRARNRGYKFWDVLLASAVLAMSFSVKWTGLAFFGLAMAVMMWDVGSGCMLRAATRRPGEASRSVLGSLPPLFYRKEGDPARSPAHARAKHAPAPHLYSIFVLVAIAVVVYIAIFWIHFALLPNPGPGDAFMLQNFREKPFIAKTLELNSAMFSASQGLQAEHPYASPAWTWPLMLRPIFYWVSDFGDNAMARIYFLGNPVVWWMSTFGLFAAALFWRPRSRQVAFIKWVLYAGWLINTLPFLGIQRVMFLYHYLPALGFAVAILAGWLGDALTRQRFLQVATVIIAAAAISFIFFAPLSYGLPLSAEQYKMRLWLDSWK